MVVPAVAVGAFVIFGIGYVATSGVLSMIETWKRKRGRTVPSAEEIDSLSKLGGGVAVVLVLILLFAVPREWTSIVWYGLTIIGIIGGLLSFALFGSDSTSRNGMNNQNPPESTNSPNANYQQTRNQGYGRGGQYRDPPSKTDSNASHTHQSRDSLYQDLLIKTRNNSDLADRLIEYERKHKPNASEIELVKNAIERWERDNR